MKKCWRSMFSLGMAVLLLFSAGVSSFAEETEKTNGAKGEILLEMTTGTIFLEKNADEPLPMASLTKLMGMILIGEKLEEGKLALTDSLTCSEYAKGMGGSEIWLKEGESMTVEELLKAVTIASANDAMVVFAEKIGGTEEGFVSMMNEKAEEMGLTNTHFCNATGFDEEGHHTSARDIAKMAMELQKYPQVTQFCTVWMDSLRQGKTELVNTNRLVRFYEGTTGLKTGTTDQAGYCLCATAKRDDLALCSVVLGCSTTDERFARSKELLDHGFSNYTMYHPEAPQLLPLKVIHGVEESVPLRCAMPQGVVVTKEEAKIMEESLPELTPIRAPVEKGQTVGTVTLSADGREVLTYPIEAAQSVGKLNVSACLYFLFRGLMGEG